MFWSMTALTDSISNFASLKISLRITVNFLLPNSKAGFRLRTP